MIVVCVGGVLLLCCIWFGDLVWVCFSVGVVGWCFLVSWLCGLHDMMLLWFCGVVGFGAWIGAVVFVFWFLVGITGAVAVCGGVLLVSA